MRRRNWQRRKPQWRKRALPDWRREGNRFRFNGNKGTTIGLRMEPCQIPSRFRTPLGIGMAEISCGQESIT